jgi:Icc protein
LKVDEIGKLKNRKEVISLLRESSILITIYCGHYHMESTLVYKNMTQNITPALSFQMEKNPNNIEINTSVFGYRIIEIKNKMTSSKIQYLKDAD